VPQRVRASHTPAPLIHPRPSLILCCHCHCHCHCHRDHDCDHDCDSHAQGPGASCQGKGKPSTRMARPGSRGDTGQIVTKREVIIPRVAKYRSCWLTAIYSRTLVIVSHAPGPKSRPRFPDCHRRRPRSQFHAAWAIIIAVPTCGPRQWWADQCQCRQVRAHLEMTSPVPLSSLLDNRLTSFASLTTAPACFAYSHKDSLAVIRLTPLRTYPCSSF